MLIRSQDKEMIINMAATNQIYVREVYLLSGSLFDIISDEMRLEHYSIKEKAMKVLDMIQEAYADAKLNEILLPDVCKSASESQMGKDNTLIAKTIRKDFMKKMIFQMPEDSEVEARAMK
jgi:hypothetical protein